MWMSSNDDKVFISYVDVWYGIWVFFYVNVLTMSTNEVRIDDGTARFIGCCTVNVICRDIIAQRLLRCSRGWVAIRAAITNFIWICVVTVNMERRRGVLEKKVNQNLLRNQWQRRHHISIWYEFMLTHYSHDVIDHYWMVFVCQRLNYLVPCLPERASALDEIVLHLPPFLVAFLTFCQIWRLWREGRDF